MSAFLKFHDEDGDPIYILNDIVAIFTEVDKTELTSFYGEQVREVRDNEHRVILSKSSGKWEVTETYEEILAKITSAEPCE